MIAQKVSRTLIDNQNSQNMRRAKKSKEIPAIILSNNSKALKDLSITNINISDLIKL